MNILAVRARSRSRVEEVRGGAGGFGREGRPVPSLRGALVLLAGAGYTEEEQVAWLLSSGDELRARPIDVLLSGNKSAVRRAAQSLF